MTRNAARSVGGVTTCLAQLDKHRARSLARPDGMKVVPGNFHDRLGFLTVPRLWGPPDSPQAQAVGFPTHTHKYSESPYGSSPLGSLLRSVRPPGTDSEPRPRRRSGQWSLDQRIWCLTCDAATAERVTRTTGPSGPLVGGRLVGRLIDQRLAQEHRSCQDRSCERGRAYPISHRTWLDHDRSLLSYRNLVRLHRAQSTVNARPMRGLHATKRGACRRGTRRFPSTPVMTELGGAVRRGVGPLARTTTGRSRGPPRRRACRAARARRSHRASQSRAGCRPPRGGRRAVRVSAGR